MDLKPSTHNQNLPGLNCWQLLLTTNTECKYLDFVCITLYSVLVILTEFHTDDRVRPQTEEEKQLYKLLSAVTQRPSSSLSSRWREPSLTVHNIQISGPKCQFLTDLFVQFYQPAPACRCIRDPRPGAVAGVPAHRSRPRPGHH
jgi:hypothetical protein